MTARTENRASLYAEVTARVIAELEKGGLLEDERVIFRAASAASRAADYLLGFLPAEETRS